MKAAPTSKIPFAEKRKIRLNSKLPHLPRNILRIDIVNFNDANSGAGFLVYARITQSRWSDLTQSRFT